MFNEHRANPVPEPKVPADQGLDLSAQPRSEPAPTLEEINAQVTATHKELAELQRLKEELDRKRAALEELKRKRTDFQLGRQEVIQRITRALELLDQAKIKAEREAEEISQSMYSLREALERVQSINESTWTADNLHVELARALAIIEQARLEWGAARRKFPLLDNPEEALNKSTFPMATSPIQILLKQPFKHLWKIGLALTWPLILTFLLMAFVLILFLRR